MNRHWIRRLLALSLALALLVCAVGLAEEDDALAVEAATEGVVEPSVEEATGLLGELQPAVEPQPAAAAPAVQNVVPKKVTLGVKQKYTLDGQSLAPGKKVTYQTSKSSVATVSGKGVVTAKKAGTAKITCYRGKTKLATCTVKVVAAPKKVSLGVSTITIGVKESVQLTPTITKGTQAGFTWSSKKKSIATVTQDGVVKGKKAGKTTVSVKTHNGLTATVTVKVAKAPASVSLNKTSKTLYIGGTLSLKATLPSGTASNKLTWSSSDAGVAKVSASGKVTAVAAGKATITVSTYNKKKAACEVTVKSADAPPRDDTVKYRALLVGEEYFSWESSLCTRNRGDVGLMAAMLDSVKGLYGGYFDVTRRYDLSTDEILDAIATTFADADDNDVSLFFIATHGDADYSGVYAGALATSPDDTLLMRDLADALSAVPGKVIVFLESCGAGAAVYGNSKGASPSAEAQAKAFDQAAVRAFSAADPGIVVQVESGGLKSNGVVANTGEFRRENKFYVLAASAYQELSWGTQYWNFFTRWLTQGIGTSGRMPADTNLNGQTTLKELYKYISKVGDGYGMNPGDGEIYYQHVQVYPSGSSYVLFTR